LGLGVGFGYGPLIGGGFSICINRRGKFARAPRQRKGGSTMILKKPKSER